MTTNKSFLIATFDMSSDAGPYEALDLEEFSEIFIVAFDVDSTTKQEVKVQWSSDNGSTYFNTGYRTAILATDFSDFNQNNTGAFLAPFVNYGGSMWGHIRNWNVAAPTIMNAGLNETVSASKTYDLWCTLSAQKIAMNALQIIKSTQDFNAGTLYIWGSKDITALIEVRDCSQATGPQVFTGLGAYSKLIIQADIVVTDITENSLLLECSADGGSIFRSTGYITMDHGGLNDGTDDVIDQPAFKLKHGGGGTGHQGTCVLSGFNHIAPTRCDVQFTIEAVERIGRGYLTNVEAHDAIRVSAEGGSAEIISGDIYITGVLSDPPPAPSNQVLPTITGGTDEGELVTCVTILGDWTDADSFTFDWFINGVTQIPVADENPYRLHNDDIGDNVTCSVTATGPGGTTTVETTDNRFVQAALWNETIFQIQVTGGAPNPPVDESPGTTHTVTNVNSVAISSTEFDTDTGSDTQTNIRHFEMPDHSDWDLGPSDWTVELWGVVFERRTAGNSNVVAAQWTVSGDERCWQLDWATTNMRILTSTDGIAEQDDGGSLTIAISTTYDIMLQRRGDLIELYINDTRDISATRTGTLHDSSGKIFISRNYDGGSSSPGNFEFKAMRVTKGTARGSGTTHVMDTLPLDEF